MKQLADVAHGRDNNFHLFRLLAAAAVLFSHSYPLATGSADVEPLRSRFGCTAGSTAVDLFFLISGLLVTISLVRRNSAMDFVRARFFRIWPGLTMALLLTVFVLGPVFTTLSAAGYLSSPETWRYLFKNVLLLHGINYRLPGVFIANPWTGAVNGSLWTLPSEVKCYLVLLAGWFLLQKIGRPAFFKAAISIAWLILLGWHLHGLAHGTLEDSPGRLYFMFCSGAVLYLHRSMVRLSALASIGATVVVALCAGHGMLFGVAYSLALPYVMLCVAYLPGGRLLAFNRVGDYSYGTYIYAFPVQQSLMAVLPQLGPLSLFLSSLAVTLALAVISWHLIEKPAIGLARRPTPKPVH